MQGIPQGQQNNPGGSQKPSLSWSAPHKGAPAQDKPKAAAPTTKTNDKAPAQSSSNMATYVGIFVAGLIVGGLVGWIALSGGRSGTSSTSMAGDEGSTTTSIDLSGSAMGDALQGLTIASGQASGATVAISHIAVDQPTWVVIYDDAGGLPGRALGAQLFFPLSQGGEQSGIVSLMRNTLAGHSYLAGERIDNGDRAYDASTDHLILDSKGQPLTVQFSIQ